MYGGIFFVAMVLLRNCINMHKQLHARASRDAFRTQAQEERRLRRAKARKERAMDAVSPIDGTTPHHLATLYGTIGSICLKTQHPSL